MKVYTKTGDKGTTALFGGKRVPKSDLRIDAYGNVDELNSYIGLLRDLTEKFNLKEELVGIQNNLFVAGSILATEPGNTKVKVPQLTKESVASLEKRMDAMEEDLPPMRFFVLPGGHSTLSYCHIARTVCRRAERGVIALNETEEVQSLVIQYLNRLSDYLFVLSRWLTVKLNAEEIPWKPTI